MIPRIRHVQPSEGYKLFVDFDEGRRVVYDVSQDIRTLPAFASLATVTGLFQNVRLDSSRTVVYWNEQIDLPSDTIYEYGQDCPS